MFWDPSEGEQAQRRVSGGRGSRVSGRLQLLQGSPGFFGGFQDPLGFSRVGLAGTRHLRLRWAPLKRIPCAHAW